MRFPCTFRHTAGGQWALTHESPEVGRIELTAPTRDEALERLRAEIRYRLELCPCSRESYQHIQIEISDR